MVKIFTNVQLLIIIQNIFKFVIHFLTFNFIQENQVCYKQYDSQYDPQGQFCGTHRLQSGIIADSCQADSGGPLQCETPLAEENRKSEIKNAVAKEKRYTLWGITSYGGNSQGLCSDAAGTNHNGTV